MQITIDNPLYRLQLIVDRAAPIMGVAREVVTEREARSLLAPCMHEDLVLRRVRSLLREIDGGLDARLDDDPLESLLRWVSRGRLSLWLETPPVRNTTLTVVPDAEAFEPLVRESEVELSRVAFQVLERHDGTPVPGIALSITLPDGSVTEMNTDDDGLVDLRDIPEGTCSVRSERAGKHRGQSVVFTGFGYFVPSNVRAVSGWSREILDGLHPAEQLANEDQASALVKVVEHRVATGDTLESIAEQHGVSVDDITQYNWDTTDPAAISAALGTEVGCHRRNPDTGEFELSDDDDPGIIMVPLPFECSGRVTDTRHILQVDRPRPRPRWVFSL